MSCLERSSSNPKLLKTITLVILFLKHKIRVYLACFMIHKHQRPRFYFIFLPTLSDILMSLIA